MRRALLALALLAGCSADDCRRIKGSPNFVGSWLCGAQGDEPPPADAPPPLCKRLDQLAPVFFALVRDPSRPLDGLRRTLEELDAPQCLDRTCARPYRPLAELLRAVLDGLAALAREPREPGTPPGARCAATPPPARTRACDLRRAFDRALGEDGGRALLADPRLRTVVSALARYAPEHPEAAAALGRMMKAPDACPPADFLSLAEKLLFHFTPAAAAEVSGTVRALISDPDLRPFIAALTAGGSAPGRASVIFLVHHFVGQARAVARGSEAAARLEEILQRFVYPAVGSDRLRGELAAAFDLFKRAMADEVGAFPALQRLIACADDPSIGGGALVGAAYDLLALREADGGIDAATLLGLVDRASAIDADRQLSRAAREIALAIAGDEHAAEAVRGVLAQVLCGSSVFEASCDGRAFAQGLLPAVALLVDRGALADLFVLLDTLLHGCGP